MTTATPVKPSTVLPQEQALVDAGINPAQVRTYVKGALSEHLLDEVRSFLQCGNIENYDELTNDGVDAEQLIIDYIAETIVIDFENATL